MIERSILLKSIANVSAIYTELDLDFLYIFWMGSPGPWSFNFFSDFSSPFVSSGLQPVHPQICIHLKKVFFCYICWDLADTRFVKFWKSFHTQFLHPFLVSNLQILIFPRFIFLYHQNDIDNFILLR